MYKCHNWKVPTGKYTVNIVEGIKMRKQSETGKKEPEKHGSQRRRTFQESGEAAVSTAAKQQRRMRKEKRPLGL